MADQIRVNGNLVSWGSIIMKIDGERITGFSSISYGDSRERTKGYGQGRSQGPRGRSRGKYTTEVVSVTGFNDTIEEVRLLLSDGNNMGDTEVEIVVQYIEGDNAPVTDVIEQCVLTKNASNPQEGADALTQDIEFDCMRIRWNGRTLYDSSEAT